MNTPPKELRLALCMRGGVSLAVWMGGACREIAALRSATNQTVSDDARDLAQRRVYQRILKLAGYDEVTVDVIASRHSRHSSSRACGDGPRSTAGGPPASST